MQRREEYLREYHGIDVALDTVPYNGHTTSLDAFWMGVPVVTLVGETVVGRAGWSQLCNLDLKELAAHSEEQFVLTATALANDLVRLADMRGVAGADGGIGADGRSAISAEHGIGVPPDVAELVTGRGPLKRGAKG